MHSDANKPNPPIPPKEPLRQRAARKLNFMNWLAIALLIASAGVMALRHLKQ